MAVKKAQPGSLLRICDRTGFRARADETRKEWTGAIVRNENWEPRHPQDFVRSKPDEQRVVQARPQQIDQFVGPLKTEITEAASPGATTVKVLSSTRMQGGDNLGITLNDGDVFRVILQTVSDATTIILADPLPGSVSPDNQVVNYTAVAQAEIE